jgi:radical SAM protein with 4Fe4S-binding SPASM domain
LNKRNCYVYVKIADIALKKGEEELFYSRFADISDRMFIENIRPIFENSKNSVEVEKSISKYGQFHSPVIVCPQPFFMMNVTPEGDVYPCCAYFDPTNFGNLRDKSLKEIWSGSAMKEFQIMMLRKERKTRNSFPVCRDCTIPDVVMLPEDDLDSHTEEILLRY